MTLEQIYGTVMLVIFLAVLPIFIVHTILWFKGCSRSLGAYSMPPWPPDCDEISDQTEAKNEPRG